MEPSRLTWMLTWSFFNSLAIEGVMLVPFVAKPMVNFYFFAVWVSSKKFLRIRGSPPLKVISCTPILLYSLMRLSPSWVDNSPCCFFSVETTRWRHFRLHSAVISQKIDSGGGALNKHIFSSFTQIIPLRIKSWMKLLAKSLISFSVDLNGEERSATSHLEFCCRYRASGGGLLMN